MAMSLNSENFDKQVLSGKLPVLVEFMAEWSGACHMMTPILNKLEIEFAGQLNFYRMDADYNKEIFERLDIADFPTLLFFSNGQIMDRVTYAVPIQIVREKICELLQLGN